VRRARLAVSRSRVLGGSQALLTRGDGTLVRRCAWCDRYEIGGVWTPARRLPRFLKSDERRVGGKELTHTICPPCFERATGGAGTGPAPRDSGAPQ
jgi:hypothetical protein